MNKYIYKISIMNTNFYYIGIHIGDNNDDYLGSSAYFGALKFCYPSIELKKEVIYVFPDDFFDVSEYKIFEKELLNQINIQENFESIWTLKDMRDSIRNHVKMYNRYSSLTSRYWELIHRYVDKNIKVYECKYIESDIIKRYRNDFYCMNVIDFEPTIMKMFNLNMYDALLLKKLYFIYNFQKIKTQVRNISYGNNDKKDKTSIYINLSKLSEPYKILYNNFMNEDYILFLSVIESIKKVLY